MSSFLSSGYNIILAKHKLFLTEAYVRVPISKDSICGCSDSAFYLIEINIGKTLFDCLRYQPK